MDAISFVVGLKARHLRGAELKDLIHRTEDGSSGDSAFVELVYVVQDDNLDAHNDGDELHFRRSITQDGKSVYSVNGKAMKYDKYNQVLASIGILVKARNFLVFQVRFGQTIAFTDVIIIIITIS